MILPVGVLIFWVAKIEEKSSIISGMWYYKEMGVPATKEEKKMSIQDLKSKRCTAITIHGTFEQILDILSQGDLFINNDTNGELEFTNLISDIERTPREKAYLFDDVYNIKGTALMIDLAIEVDESLSNIKECIRKGNPVMVNISENWSMRDELIKEFRKM